MANSCQELSRWAVCISTSFIFNLLAFIPDPVPLPNTNYSTHIIVWVLCSCHFSYGPHSDPNKILNACLSGLRDFFIQEIIAGNESGQKIWGMTLTAGENVEMALPSMFSFQPDSYGKRRMPLTWVLPDTFFDSLHVEEKVSSGQWVPRTLPHTGYALGCLELAINPHMECQGRCLSQCPTLNKRMVRENGI